MTELERLDEAIKQWPSASLDEINAEGGVGDVIFAAARAYRNLLAIEERALSLKEKR